MKGLDRRMIKSKVAFVQIILASAIGAEGEQVTSEAVAGVHVTLKGMAV